MKHVRPPRASAPGRLLLGLAAALVAVAAGAPAAAQQHSVARQWNDLLLESIRRDLARPTVHARNLYHVSLAMWDGWATYDPVARPVLFREDHATTAAHVDALRSEAISHAVYHILRVRFAGSPGAATMLPAYDGLMTTLGYDPNDLTTVGDTPAAIGNRIARDVLTYGSADNSNEAGGYANLHYAPINRPLLPDFPGNPNFVAVDRWQPLSLQFFIDQSGNPIPNGYPGFLSPEWGIVSHWALDEEDVTIGERDGFHYWVYQDPGPPPLHDDPQDRYRHWFEMVSVWSSHLDPSDGVMIDASPNAIGNAALPAPSDAPSFYDYYEGGDWAPGYQVNPVTGQPYPPQPVLRGDYARVLAEFWADGPDSETPPGHWFVILNDVSDDPAFVKRIGGSGPVVNDLEWCVKSYLAMGGAMHDCAVAAWGVKGWYDYPRPVSVIRHLADLGQRSDPNLPGYHPDGINLHPGKIEVVTAQTTAAGQRHEHLAGSEGKIAVFAWRGPAFIQDPAIDVAGCGWILAENWWPYQRPSFVTPPFAGYVSGHSTYSRAAAVVMHLMTGSRFFPGGLGEFVCPAGSFLVFEDGPSMDVHLQWVSYYDASDQCSLSRIWGGIHPPVDDIPGRHMGQAIGLDAMDLARRYWAGTACDAPGGTPSLDVDMNGVLDTCEDIGVPFCSPGIPNSTGLPGALVLLGREAVAQNDLTLVATSLPPQTFGFFVASRDQAPPVVLAGSQGRLCLGGAIGRSVGGGVQQASAGGVFSTAVDLQAMAQPGGPVAVQPGETWTFQAWHRDANPGTTSNLTSAKYVTFE